MTQLDIIRRKDMKRLLVAVAMTAFVASHAWAGNAVTPRTDVMLTGDVVTVGDVFDGVTHDADHVLAPAPAYGKTMVLAANDLTRISDAFNLGWYPSDGYAQTTLRRDAHEVSQSAIEAALEEKMAAAVTGQKFDVAIGSGNANFHLPATVAATFDVTDMKFDIAKGDFRATVAAPAGAASPVEKKEIYGKIYPLTSVPVLSRAVNQGSVIAIGDVQYIDMRANDISASTVVDVNQLVGQSPRRMIAALKPVAGSDLTPPALVKKGEIVTMALQNNAIQLTAQGRALENGTAGDVVRIVNTSSQQVIQAVVTGPQTVTVQAPGAALIDDNI